MEQFAKDVWVVVVAAVGLIILIGLLLAVGKVLVDSFIYTMDGVDLRNNTRELYRKVSALESTAEYKDSVIADLKRQMEQRVQALTAQVDRAKQINEAQYARLVEANKALMELNANLAANQRDA